MKALIKQICPLFTVTAAVLSNASFPLPFGVSPLQAAYAAFCGLAVYVFLVATEPAQTKG